MVAPRSDMVRTVSWNEIKHTWSTCGSSVLLFESGSVATHSKSELNSIALVNRKWPLVDFESNALGAARAAANVAAYAAI